MNQEACNARYLEAVVRVTPGLVHDVRAVLGSLSLNLSLLAETLRRDAPDPAAGERVQGLLARAQAGIPNVLAAVERLADLTRPAPSAPASFDLGAWVVALEAVLAPWLQERRVTWTARPPDGATRVGGDPEAVRRALFALAVAAVDAAPAGSAIDAGLSRAGTHASLTFALRPAAGPAPALSGEPWRSLGADIQALGGELRTLAPPEGAALEVHLPLAARAVG